MNILITNDDGIHAEGLVALKKELQKIGRVQVIAPDRPRSACGHSITLHKPLRADPVKLSDGSIGYSSNGTPSDCVSLGLHGVVEGSIDLIISGINLGPNLGWDLTYSGTVSAAMEGAVAGLPSIAISLVCDKHRPDVDYSYAAAVTRNLALKLMEHGLPKHTLLNVNVPDLPENEIKGLAITIQGKREYDGELETRVDPSGRRYYWLRSDGPKDTLDEGTDVRAANDGWVSVTPVHLDLTDYRSVELMKSWAIESSKG